MKNAIVVNLRDEPFDVYVGRAGRGEAGYFGNPYRVGQTCPRCGKLHASKASTIPCFRAYFLERVERDTGFRKRVLALRGKALGCFCKPGPCHGDVIAEWVNGVTS